MFLPLWRRLWNRNPVPPGGKCLRGDQRLSCRPRVEPLEDRTLPAWWGGGVLAIAPVSGTVGGLPQTGIKRPGDTTQILVTVDQNSPETVIDLGAAFGAVSGLQHGDGLKLAILGNTNSGLVRTDLSEAALTLTYARGKYGTATISVCATDADGVSVKQSILVTVRPLSSAGVVYVTPIDAGLQVPMTPGIPR